VKQTNKKENIIAEKAYSFALSIIELYKNMRSRKDFISKMSIASKEARETNYWLRLLRDSGLCPGTNMPKLIRESKEIIAILTSIVKTSKDRSV